MFLAQATGNVMIAFAHITNSVSSVRTPEFSMYSSAHRLRRRGIYTFPTLA